MRAIRPGLLAYLAFLLACAIPAWKYRVDLSVDLQLRLVRPPWGRRCWNVLGPRAAEQLLRVLKSDPSPVRRERAGNALLCCEDPVVRATVLVLRCYGPRPVLMGCSQHARISRSEWETAIDGLPDDELVVAVRKPEFHMDKWLFGRPTILDFWEARPARCERIVAKLLGSTGDAGLARSLAASGCHTSAG